VDLVALCEAAIPRFSHSTQVLLNRMFKFQAFFFVLLQKLFFFSSISTPRLSGVRERMLFCLNNNNTKACI
jgi:hypothetical protein